MATIAYTLLGRWKGGPYKSKFTIFWEDDGTAGAEFVCPSGAKGKVSGRFMDGCRRLKGRFTDPDGDAKGERVDILLDAGGKEWRTEGPSWSGRRFKWKSSKTLGEAPTNERWERLQRPINRQERSDRARKQWEAQYDADISTKMAQKNGLMGAVAPLCIGDPFIDAPKVDPRLLGRNLVCTTSKTGKVGEGTTFSNVQPICIGDPYLGADQRAQNDRQKQRDALRDKAPFKPAGQRIVGRRDEFLLLVDSQTPVDIVKAKVDAAMAAKKRDKVVEVIVKPRNVYTTAKVGEMLGPQTEEGKKMYEHHHSDFDIPTQIRMEEIRVWHEKLGDKPAFRRAVPGGRLFSTDAEVHYGMGPGAPVKPPLRTETKPDNPDLPPFKPVTVTKSSRESACFGKFPAYMSDPVPEHVFKVVESDKPSFKPTSYGKTTQTKSVTLHKTNLRARMTKAGSRIKI